MISGWWQLAAWTPRLLLAGMVLIVALLFVTLIRQIVRLWWR